MLSLVADYSDSSPSSSDSEVDVSDEDEKLQTKLPIKQPPKPLLPSASALLSSTSKPSTGIVFNNPFLEAERAEINKLQKHVQMVESEEHLTQKNGRKICWNNRKGRCRFGNKCKYAHDSDLVAGDDDNNEGEEHPKEEISSKTPPSGNATIVKSAQLSHNNASAYQAPETTDSKLKTRKRPGLGDSIVPGKKVLKQYQSSKTKVTNS